MNDLIEKSKETASKLRFYAPNKKHTTEAAVRIDALIMEVKNLEQDAKRYQWIRELPNADSLNVRFMGADLDKVIDASLGLASNMQED